MSFDTISVIGLGYIGLPTAAMFASCKNRVVGVDVNQKTIETINRGEIHIVEPGLNILVHEAVMNGYLTAGLVPEAADAFLIAVPTPLKNNNSDIPEPDLTYIRSAANLIAPFLKKGDLVILESTSPVGTTEQLSDWLAVERPDLSFPQSAEDKSDINIAYCPERVLPGNVVKELVENDRVIGGMSVVCSKRAIKLYKIFVKGEFLITNARTAEMVKLTENSCRDVQIAFANELSIICDKLDINVWELISIANRHPRINILQPGPGVGGHCIAVDPFFIISKTPRETRIIKAAREVNDAMPDWVIDKVKKVLIEFLYLNPDKKIEDTIIACFGLTFKSDIDDLRESPALDITRKLAKMHNGQVVAVEPHISLLDNEDFELVTIDKAIAISDISVLLVDHLAFKEIKSPTNQFYVDTRGIWNL
jgi:UDP-N-acetyl-D-mannosaminuronic acid dehydrogenase